MSKPVVDAAAWMERFGMFPPPGGTILCAVSGGRDSVCLLDYLWRLGQERGFSVAAAHLNHGMRPTAQRDEELVRRLCRQRDIPFYTEKVDVYALCDAWRLTVEETGRRARYEFLRRTAASIGAAFIATAHHREDQAETVLLQLLRGTGPQGLAGIPPVREGIIRPLLDTPRAAIDAYIAAHDLPYVTDETNLDTHYARNRLRLEIMPQLLTINPSAPAHICRTADILRAENDYLDAQAAALLPDTGTALPCHTLLSAPAALRPRMLRLLAERLPVGKKDFSAAHYRALETLAQTGGTLSLPGGAAAGKTLCQLPQLSRHAPVAGVRTLRAAAHERLRQACYLIHLFRVVKYAVDPVLKFTHGGSPPSSVLHHFSHAVGKSFALRGLQNLAKHVFQTLCVAAPGRFFYGLRVKHAADALSVGGLGDLFDLLGLSPAFKLPA